MYQSGPIHKISRWTSPEMHRVYSLSGFNRWPLKTFQLSFIYQLCTSTHHLVRQISQRPGCNTDTPLIYLIRCDKKMAENDLISSSRNQGKGEKEKCVSTMCHAAWLLLRWTMFQAPSLPIILFPLTKLNWNTFCRLKNTVKTLWIPCAAVWQPTNAGVLLQTQRGASQQTCRPTKTESCLNTYFHWERGEGSPASFNQDLKTGEPLIKSRLCTFILFLSRLCWLVSAALILRPSSVVSDLSLLPITRWSSCDVEKETSNNPWPHLPLLRATSKWACVVCCAFCFLRFFSPCRETAINFPNTVTNITSWVKRGCDRVLPDYVRGQPLFNLDMFLVMRPNPAAGLLADVMPERFGIMLIGTVPCLNVRISLQRTPGGAKRESPSA